MPIVDPKQLHKWASACHWPTVIVAVFIVDDTLVENAVDTVGNTVSGTIEDISQSYSTRRWHMYQGYTIRCREEYSS